jgi:acylglycerol lipase
LKLQKRSNALWINYNTAFTQPNLKTNLMIQIIHLKCTDGKKIQGRYTKSEESKYIVIFVHGLGEHAARYDRFASLLGQNGISSISYDQRGHGTTPGIRGHIGKYEQALDDVGSAMEIAAELEPSSKIVLLGHSMGGNIVAGYLSHRTTPYPQKAILSSSWIELAFQPSKFQLILAKIGGVLSPSLTQPNGLNSNDLSHLKVEVDAYDNDPLVHKKISAGTYLQIFKEGLSLLSSEFIPAIPVLISHGELDKVTSRAASEVLAKKWNAPFQVWLHSKHEPHNDQEMNLVMNYAKDFILSS